MMRSLSEFIASRRLRLAQLIQRAHIELTEKGLRQFLQRLFRWLRGERRYYRRKPGQRGPSAPFRLYDGEIMARYYEWIAEVEPDAEELQRQRQVEKSWTYRPLVSVVVPVYDPPPGILSEAIDSVLTQTYSNVEICIANAGSDPDVRTLLDGYQKRDSRVHVDTLPANRGISGNTNAALSLAHGEFVAFMDHDDLLAPFALYAVVEALNANPDLDVLYSDQDKLTMDGERVEAFLKPDWSPELLHIGMYTGHLSVYRKSLVESLGGLRSEYDGSQDYDLILRAAEVTQRIQHIPRILYHWRMLPTSAASSEGQKSWARKTNLAALATAMRQRGYTGEAIIDKNTFRNRFRFDVVGQPLVSIIIPTDSEANAEKCLKGLSEKTDYGNLEVIVVTNSTLAEKLEASSSPGLTLHCVPYDEDFNFSRKCNVGAQAARGEYLLFLNDDVIPLESGWIQAMLEYAQQPEIGGVSPKLLYSNDTIQYAGMVTGVRDLVGTAFHLWEPYDLNYHALASCVRNVSVLTGACLMIRAELFEEIGGWDEENTPIANSDLDFSFRLLDRGYRLVYTPHATLRHIGHQSIGKVETGPRLFDDSHLYMLARWGEYVSYDPYFPPQMRDLVYADADGYEVHAAASERNVKALQAGRRFLFVSHDLSLSGAPLMLFALAKYLQSHGHFVSIVAEEGGKLIDQLQAHNIPVIVDPHVLNSASASRPLFAPFDLIITSTVLGWPAVLTAKSIDQPCVWLIHEPEFGLTLLQPDLRRARKAFELADAIIYPARSALALYEDFAPDTRHEVVYYGIEDPRLQTAADETSLQAQTGKIRIAHVGSIEYRKGADVLISALKLLPVEALEQIEVYFIGRALVPGYADEMRRRALGFPNVHFIGEIEHDMVLKYMADSDVFVCTSRQETGPIVVMEAMGLGKAVITTRVGAVAELIEDGVNGYVIDVDNAVALKQRLLELVENPDRIASIGQRAEQFCESHLTLERYGRDLLDIFDEVLAASSERSRLEESR